MVVKIKLSQYAKMNSVCYKTAYLWFKAGKIKEKTEISPSGSIFVYMNELSNTKNIQVYTYSRVSSNNKKDDLNRQQERCVEYCFNTGCIQI
jgi:predicted site-specific integrase-resolvase